MLGNAEVVQALTNLAERDPDPLVVRLPRTRGRKDSEYMHLFGGPVDADAYVEEAGTARPATSSQRGGVAELAKSAMEKNQS